ncbi:hypothetical protein JQS43_13110 [Natronosporangium hydrolyticum]|uniref:PH domain-containing protein n=1 Tax=Natronosporangium hydrolyticum TaxID=2811111 RepID=A0A895Y8L2_9ACTN|nr:STM3941 family protein [Natronosporangium hydrolyticum]QSB12645.1 hypothetical protein JQS43_13110 [Natronosporangium hydrolyticum]
MPTPMRSVADPGYGVSVDGAGSSPAPGGETVFYPPRGRLLLLAAGTGFMALASYLPTLSRFTLLVVGGWIMIVLLMIAALVLVARALRPGPSVVVDSDGIIDRTTLGPCGRIRWEEINVVRKREIGRGMGAERLLEILLTGQAAEQRRPAGWLRRLTERYRAALKQPPISLPGSMISVPMQGVVDALRQHRPQLEVLQGPPPAPSKFRWGPKPEKRRQHPQLPRW